MKKYIWLHILISTMFLTACGSQPTQDPDTIVQTAVGMISTQMAQTQEAIPSETPTLSPDVMTQVAVTEMVGNKNLYQALDYMELVTSDDHLMEKVVFSGTITKIENSPGVYLLTDPNYSSEMTPGNVLVNLLMPATDLMVGDVVTVYGVYISRAFETRPDGGTEYYFIVLDSAFYEK